MGWIIGTIRISKDKESIWNANRFERNPVGLWDILDFFFIASISWETFHSLCQWLNVLRLMILFQVVLGSFNLSISQVLLKEIMSVISTEKLQTLAHLHLITRSAAKPWSCSSPWWWSCSSPSWSWSSWLVSWLPWLPSWSWGWSGWAGCSVGLLGFSKGVGFHCRYLKESYAQSFLPRQKVLYMGWNDSDFRVESLRHLVFCLKSSGVKKSSHLIQHNVDSLEEHRVAAIDSVSSLLDCLVFQPVDLGW